MDSKLTAIGQVAKLMVNLQIIENKYNFYSLVIS